MVFAVLFLKPQESDLRSIAFKARTRAAAFVFLVFSLWLSASRDYRLLRRQFLLNYLVHYLKFRLSSAAFLISGVDWVANMSFNNVGPQLNQDLWTYAILVPLIDNVRSPRCFLSSSDK